MSRSRFVRARSLALTFTLLATSGSLVFAAKDVFVRSKPHVNVGTIGGVQMDIWVHVEAALFADGYATGEVQFTVSDRENFFYRVISASTVIVGDNVIGLDLIVERVGDGGEGTGEGDVVTVRRSTAAEDCLIYDVVGANIHVEAEGTIELRDPVRD